MLRRPWSYFSKQDGGLNWLPKYANTLSDLYGVFFVDANTGWITGDDGMLLCTSDGGETWTKKYLDSFLYLLKVFFINSSIGWIISEDYSFGGSVFKTVDGGNTWTSVFTSSDGFRFIEFIDSNIGWAITTNRNFYKTTDGGINWVLQEHIDFDQIFFMIDANVGWRVSYNGKVFKTSNGGSNWIEIATIPISFSQFPRSIKFVNSSIGFVVLVVFVIYKLLLI